MASDPILELAEWIVDEYAAWMQNFNNLQTDATKDDPYTPTAPQFIADSLRSRLRQVGGIGPSGRYSELPAEHLPKEFDLVYVLESKKGGV